MRLKLFPTVAYNTSFKSHTISTSINSSYAQYDIRNNHQL